ncbi:hypothetical protein [Qipengyuania citrea]|uniref:hypothetical protein n=1 Tax=Qipengyuania citrea TaxID=225971 RepID=UPI001E568D84|nr:hypothetical protein [Qipengyuania citrea]
MSAHQPILPSKAIERVEAAGFSEARKLLADFAAAGLIKTYALARATTPTGQSPETVRDAAIPAEVWQRINAEGKVAEAMEGGTVRLAGSDLIGGEPEVQITAISFSHASLSKVLDRYCSQQQILSTAQAKAVVAPARKAQPPVEEQADPKARADAKAPPPILPGDVVSSVAQAMRATGLGRTKINDLMNDGTLVRKKMGRRTLITVESIERLLG